MSPTLIVGAGPVGLTMAAELARYGLPVCIIDRSPHPAETSRAVVIWSRTLELLERMGCAALRAVSRGRGARGGPGRALSGPAGAAATQAARGRPPSRRAAGRLCRPHRAGPYLGRGGDLSAAHRGCYGPNRRL
nr:FAD-dependent oxidoreductase [Pararoseomonas indoligenes]